MNRKQLTLNWFIFLRFLFGFSLVLLSVKKHIIVDGTCILNVPIPPYTVVVFHEYGMLFLYASIFSDKANTVKNCVSDV